MYWDRFDICAAYYLFATLYHGGQSCPIYATFAQLRRLGYNPGPSGDTLENLSENAREIFEQLVTNHCRSLED